MKRPGDMKLYPIYAVWLLLFLNTLLILCSFIGWEDSSWISEERTRFSIPRITCSRQSEGNKTGSRTIIWLYKRLYIGLLMWQSDWVCLGSIFLHTNIDQPTHFMFSSPYQIDYSENKNEVQAAAPLTVYYTTALTSLSQSISYIMSLFLE